MSEIANHLKQARRNAGFSLGQAASRAGISKSTLSRWEAGKTQPRLPELAALAAALDLKKSQHLFLLSLLQAPRAIQRLRTESREIGPAPVLGDLLRVMRERRAWTQGQVAKKVGVTQASVARWERGERIPSTEEVHSLCYVLNASLEEVAAFTMETFNSSDSDPGLMTEGEIRAQFAALPAALRDLAFLRLESRAWQLAARSESARTRLAGVRALYSHHLFVNVRFAESEAYADRALETLDDRTTDSHLWGHAVVRKASALAMLPSTRGIRRAVELLEDWLPRVSSPEMRAWMLTERAHHLLSLGRGAETMAVLERVNRLAEVIDPEEAFWRRNHVARILARIGKPDAGYSLLGAAPSTPLENPTTNTVSDAITRARLNQAQGARADAGRWVQFASDVCDAMERQESDGAPYCRSVIESLARQL